MPTSIYARATYQPAQSKVKRNRVELLSQDVARELNTYKNFGVFPTYNDVFSKTWKNSEEENYPDDPESADSSKGQKPGTPGVRSIFNKYSAVLTGAQDANWQSGTMKEAVEKIVENASSWRLSNNVPLLDTPENRRKLRRQSACTIRDLVLASQKGWFGRAGYSYADFMFCKYMNTPNNYLITLRRFPIPVMDSITPTGTNGSERAVTNATNSLNPNIPTPIGTMVTWLGTPGNEMRQILKHSFSMPFEEQSAGWEQIDKQGGDQGILNSLEGAINPATRKAYISGNSVPAVDSFMQKFFNAGQSPYSADWHLQDDSRKVYGPVDRVKSAYKRSGAGLDWKQSFTLTFDYELKAYNGINPRQALLDLLASIISTTYTTGGFWKGGYKGGMMMQSSTFQNLAIFRTARNGGSFTDFMDAFAKDAHNGMEKVQQQVASYGGLIQAAKAALNALGGMLMGGLLNSLGRPARYWAPSLLDEQPVGLWHITIGNPNHPIMSMGNMILKNTTIEHYGPLGLDDFPTGLKVTCEFDRGKPRDQYGIEALYMNGNDRIFHTMSGKIADMYRAAQEYQKNENVSISELKANINYEDADSEPKPNQGTSQGMVNDINANKQLTDETEKAMSDVSLGLFLKKYFGSYDAEAIITSSREQAEGAFKSAPTSEPTQTDNSTEQ